MPIDENGREYILAADGETHLFPFTILATTFKPNVASAIDMTEQMLIYVDEARVLGDNPAGAVAELRRTLLEEAMKDPSVKAADERYKQALHEHGITGKLTDALYRDDARRSFYVVLGTWLSTVVQPDPRGNK